MKRNGIIALSVMLVAACQSTEPTNSLTASGTSTSSAPAAPATMKRGDTVTVAFIDSAVFDHDIHDAMANEPGTIVVTPAVPFKINAIPPRLDKWLVAVRSQGGKVAARDETVVATRSLGGVVVDVVVALYERISEHMQYTPAEKYDATLYYRTGGVVDRVLFTLK